MKRSLVGQDVILDDGGAWLDHVLIRVMFNLTLSFLLVSGGQVDRHIRE